MAELQTTYTFEGDWCLDSLTVQAQKGPVHTLQNPYLQERLRAAYLDETERGTLLACQVDDCSLWCLVAAKEGVMRVVERQGRRRCG